MNQWLNECVAIEQAISEICDSTTATFNMIESFSKHAYSLEQSNSRHNTILFLNKRQKRTSKYLFFVHIRNCC